MRLKRKMSLQAAALTCAVLLSACPEESKVSSDAAVPHDGAPAGQPAGHPPEGGAPEGAAAATGAPAPDAGAAPAAVAGQDAGAAPGGAAPGGAAPGGAAPAGAAPGGTDASKQPPPVDAKTQVAAFKREAKGIMDQETLARSGKIIHVKGMLLGDECKGKPNRIEAFVAQQTDMPPVSITQVFGTDLGHFEMVVPKQDSNMWIIAACDIDQDGQMTKKDAVACYSANPFKPTEDISAVVLKFVTNSPGDCGLARVANPKPGNPPAAPPPPGGAGPQNAAPPPGPAAAPAAADKPAEEAAPAEPKAGATHKKKAKATSPAE